MKITVNKKPLDAALRAVKGTCSSGGVIPILGCCKIAAKGGRVTVMTTNMDMWSECVINGAEADQDGAMCLGFTQLSSFIARLPVVAIEITDDGKIKAGRSKASIQPMPHEDYPSPKEESLDDPILFPADEAERVFGSALVAVSNEETRYYLCGVNIRSVDGKIRADASNGVIGISMWTEIEASTEPVIIPSLAIKSALAALSDDGLRVSLSRQTTRLSSGGFSLTTRNIDGTFPDIDRIRAADSTTAISVDKASFLEALGRVSSLTEISNDPQNKIKGRFLALEASDGTISVESASGAISTAFDEIDAEVSGPTIRAGFQPQPLAALASICPDGNIEIGMTEPLQPASVSYAGMKGWSVIMPARIGN